MALPTSDPTVCWCNLNARSFSFIGVHHVRKVLGYRGVSANGFYLKRVCVFLVLRVVNVHEK